MILWSSRLWKKRFCRLCLQNAAMPADFLLSHAAAYKYWQSSATCRMGWIRQAVVCTAVVSVTAAPVAMLLAVRGVKALARHMFKVSCRSSITTVLCCFYPSWGHVPCNTTHFCPVSGYSGLLSVRHSAILQMHLVSVNCTGESTWCCPCTKARARPYFRGHDLIRS